VNTLLLALAALLLGGPPAAGKNPAVMDTGLWGVRLGDSPETLRDRFEPQGTAHLATWTDDASKRIRVLQYSCDARARCFSLPSGAVFYFLDGKLAQAALTVASGSAPPGVKPATAMFKAEANAGLGAAAATLSAVGRRVRYFFKDGATIVWAHDAPDAEVKLYLDRLSPIGRAEAVAAGAPPQGLEKLPGGKGYAAAQLAIVNGDYDQAVTALDEVVGMKKASPLIREQAQLVLSMSLAARVKRDAKVKGADPAWKKAARRDLARARRLAPPLAEDIDALGREAGVLD
jgi:hypothetical protein